MATPMHAAVAPAEGSAWAAMRRRLVEIAGEGAHGATSYAVHLLQQAQHLGETAAWVQPQGGRLYPPDLHEAGVCLASLAVIHVPPAAGALGVPRAAELLLRSGAYGLVVLDLSAALPPATVAWQGRLLALARQHDSAVLLLTGTPAATPSLGAAVSWRLAPRRQRLGDQLYLVAPDILKNKTSLSWPDGPLQRRVPWGME